MGTRDEERELFVAAVTAQELNRMEGTDYKAIASENDPPDALFVSRSGKHPTREVEVVSLACEATIRTDNHNRRRFESALRDCFNSVGFHGYRVSVYWTENAIERGAAKETIAAFGEVIMRLAPNHGHVIIDGGELYELSPAISELAHYASVFRLPYDALEVHSTQGWYAPRDGRWIEAAVTKKLVRYAGQCSELTLVVDGLSHLDGEQIEAFRGEYRESIKHFRDIWVVTMGRAYRV